MKKVLLLLFLFSALTLGAQERPSVAGVTFGWSREDCKKVLDNRFNDGVSSFQVTANELTYRDVRFAGYYFNYTTFRFQANGEGTYLSEVSFYRSFDETESKSAIQMSDNLYRVYSEKYECFFSMPNEDGYDEYFFNLTPESPLGQCLTISTFKGETNGGEMRVWTRVYYYFNIISDLDEI